MKNLLLIAVVMAVVLSCGTAMAGWAHVAPLSVYSYWPVGPVYAYPAPIVPAPAVVDVYPVAPPVMVAPSRVFVPSTMTVRTRVSPYGRRVRQTVRYWP